MRSAVLGHVGRLRNSLSFGGSDSPRRPFACGEGQPAAACAPRRHRSRPASHRLILGRLAGSVPTPLNPPRTAAVPPHQQGEKGWVGLRQGAWLGAEKRSGKVGARSAHRHLDWPELSERSGLQATQRVLRPHLAASIARQSRVKRDHPAEAQSEARPAPALRASKKRSNQGRHQKIKPSFQSAHAPRPKPSCSRCGAPSPSASGCAQAQPHPAGSAPPSHPGHPSSSTH